MNITLWFNKLLFVSILLLIMTAPALYNGYVLVYSDTGTYIQSGMELIQPVDRPIFYGLFIRLFSLGNSLWSVILIQNLILLYVLNKFFIVFFNKYSKDLLLLTVALLTAFSSMAWYSNQIMPDIFTSIGLLSLIMILNKAKIELEDFGIYVVLILSMMIHYSNVPLFFMVLLAHVLLFKKGRLVTAVKGLGLIVVTLGISVLINYAVVGSTSINKGSHVFLMGKMLDSGVLASFLDDKCQEKEYLLCEYKDQLPSDSRILLWDVDSPVNKLGGWDQSKKAFDEVLYGIFKSPKHLWLYVKNVKSSSLSQLFQNDLGSGLVSDWYGDPSSPPYQQIEKHFHNEWNPYLQSRQNTNLWKQKLEFTRINLISNFLVYTSFLVFLLLVINRERRLYYINEEQFRLLTMIVIGIILNAVVTAGLANIYDRLQARVSWLVIIVLISVIYGYYIARKSIKKDVLHN